MSQYRKLNVVIVGLGIFAFSLVLSATIYFYKISSPEDKLPLSIIEFSPFESQNFNHVLNQSWTTVTLPDNWHEQGESRKDIISGWYRTQINLGLLPTHPLAILIASPRMNVAVYINHQYLGQGGRFTKPVARNWRTPLLFPIPVSMLNAGKNTLHIYLKTDRAGSGYFPELHLAPYNQLIKSHAIHYFFGITSVKIITLLLFIQSGIFALLWYFRKHKVFYGYCAIGALLWGLHNLTIFTVHIPVNEIFWNWLSYTTLGLYAFVSVIIFHRFFSKKIPSIERPMLIFSVLCAGVLYFLEGEVFYFVAQSIWYPASFFAGVYGAFFLLTNTLGRWKDNNIESKVIMLLGIVTIFFAGHDVLIFYGMIDWRQGYLIQHAALILFIGFTVILLSRFNSELNEKKILNRNIDQLRKKETDELEKNNQALLRLENERAGLVLDMHDGVGGSLVSILATIELGKANIQQISEALRDTLDDIRLMIDSIDIQEHDLNVVLGMFRVHIGRRLKNNEILLKWNINDLPSIPGFDPRKALLVLRILQKVVSNAVKQGRATKISLSARQFQHPIAGSTVVIEVWDNRKSPGIDKNLREKLENRASGAGYRLYFESDFSATQVKLVLPVK